jgi:hypothetical protein
MLFLPRFTALNSPGNMPRALSPPGRSTLITVAPISTICCVA